VALLLEALQSRADGRACRLAGARVGAEERQAFELKMREADAMHAG
jgi:hypothetical protein